MTSSARRPAATADRQKETGMPDRNGRRPVLLAYDGSEQAKASIREAARQLTPRRDAIVLTVWEPFAELPLAAAAPSRDLEGGVAADARAIADEGARLAGAAGFHPRPLVESGDRIWRTIVDAADEHDASIVVMGSHGRTGIGLALMGSVAADVVRHTARPVMIVHAPATGRP
jgi:nucleotide-binding universal stress UspA family protein